MKIIWKKCEGPSPLARSDLVKSSKWLILYFFETNKGITL